MKDSFDSDPIGMSEDPGQSKSKPTRSKRPEATGIALGSALILAEAAEAMAADGADNSADQDDANLGNEAAKDRQAAQQQGLAQDSSTPAARAAVQAENHLLTAQGHQQDGTDDQSGTPHTGATGGSTADGPAAALQMHAAGSPPPVQHAPATPPAQTAHAEAEHDVPHAQADTAEVSEEQVETAQAASDSQTDIPSKMHRSNGDSAAGAGTGGATSSPNSVSSDGVGGGGPATSVTASGDAQIDGILHIRKWDGSITYGFPDDPSDYEPTYNVDDNNNGTSAQFEGFSQLSADQQLAVHFALNEFTYTQPAAAVGFSVEGFTNLGISFTSTPLSANMRYANTSDNSYGLGYYPNTQDTAGDAWMGTAIQSPTQGNYGWNNTLHEIGHTLGLQHGHDIGSFGALPTAWDSLEFTVMTYRSFVGDPLNDGYVNEIWGYPQTFMMLDIAALQYMYGADYTVNSGDTVYSWNPTTGVTYIDGNAATNPGANRIFATIWDGGGRDKYDLSAYLTGVDVDLRAGESSTFSAGQLADLNSNASGGEARGNIFNALLYDDNVASLIEDATGGFGADTLTGNEVGNILSGGLSNDSLIGLEGNDSLYGGSSDDQLFGGDDNDILDGGVGQDSQYGGQGTDYLQVWTNDVESSEVYDGGDGTDWLQIFTVANSTFEFRFLTFDNIEGIYFDNQGSSTADVTLRFNGSDWDITDYVAESHTGTLITEIFSVGSAGVDLSGLSLSGFNTGDGFRIYGISSDTPIVGSALQDTIEGGSGNDTIEGGAGADSLDGGVGDRDLLSYAGSNAGVVVDLLNGLVSGGHADNDTITGFERVEGSAFDDVLDGTDGTESLYGGDGADGIYLFGGGGRGEGGDGNDLLQGDTGNDFLFGGRDNDLFTYFADGGTDFVDGGSGDDGFQFDAGQIVGASTLRGGSGDGDRIQFSAASVGEFDFRSAEVSGFERLTSFNSSVTDDITVRFNAAQFEFNEVAWGTSTGARNIEVYLDSMTVLDLSSVSIGGNYTPGTDTMLIEGDGSDEDITGFSVGDTIKGGDGQDTIDGGQGDDLIYGDEVSNFTLLSMNAGGVTDQYGEATTFQVMPTTAFTVEWLSKVDQLGSSGVAFISYAVSGSTNEFLVFGTTGGTIAVWVNGVSTDTGIPTSSVADGATHRMSVSVDTSDGTNGLIKLFIDGQELFSGPGSSTTVGAPITSNGTFIVGQDQDGSTPGGGLDPNQALKGSIGDIRVWSEALSQSFINENKFNELTTSDLPSLPSLQANWQFDLFSATLGPSNIASAQLLSLRSAGSNPFSTDVYGDDDDLSGSSGDDTIYGGAGNDAIQGGIGADSIVGGEGNDTIQGDSGDDTIHGGEGNDTIQGGNGSNTLNGGDDFDMLDYGDASTGVTVSIDSNGAGTVSTAHITDSFSSFEAIGGSNFDDVLSMLQGGTNVIHGRGGNDLITMSGVASQGALADGGSGDDTISTTLDRFIGDVAGGSGTDTFDTSLSWGQGVHVDLEAGTAYLIGNEIESFSVTGIENVIGTSNDDSITGKTSVANLIEAHSGDDTLSLGNSSFGNNTIRAGDGDDEVIVPGFFGDELDGGVGDDTLSASSSASFSSGLSINLGTGDVAFSGNAFASVTNFEHYRHLGAVNSNETIIGSALANRIEITGTGANNFQGGGGNDTLLGGSGDDTLFGGAGADSMVGGAGADSMLGGSGDDTYVINNFNDTIVESLNEGFDHVDSLISLNLRDFGQHVESLTLTGNGDLDGAGNARDNIITGNDGANELDGKFGDDTLIGGDGDDTLDGGTGADSMVGGSGDDTYYVDNVGDMIDDFPDQGHDRVFASISVDLRDYGQHVEDLTLTGSADLNGEGNARDNTIIGNAGANTLDGVYGDDALYGGSGEDTLLGGVGNDTLIGGDGADSMVGGSGDDTYYVDNVGDMIDDFSGQGHDRVFASISVDLRDYGQQVEDLILTGSADLDGEGNARDNTITGNSGANALDGAYGDDTLIGGTGNDTLDGGTGADSMVGGSGDDTYYVDNVGDTIDDFPDEGHDHVYSEISLDLRAFGQHLEDLTLTGTGDLTGEGNVRANTITGTSGANILDGAYGDDTLFGGAGNDTLIGGTGADSMVGGSGDDTYYVDNVGDMIDDFPDQGHDLVYATVSVDLRDYGQHVEDLILTGSADLDGEGNARDNTITGNSGANALDGAYGDDTLIGGTGNDTLDGGTGADSMVGGSGDDTYYVDNVGDMIDDFPDQGHDLVYATVSVDLRDYGQHVEDLTLTGTEDLTGEGNARDNTIIGNDGANTLDGAYGDDALYGGGANDTLLGSVGNDTLDGGTGADSMVGGSGDDTYYVDDAGDMIDDFPDQGHDLVYATVSVDLRDYGQHVEDLTLTGSADLNGDGNARDNTIIGNSGANALDGAFGDDTLIGGGGNDTMTGGSGVDTFQFNDPFDGVTEITDLDLGAGEQLSLNAAGFGAIVTAAGNTLSASEFHLGTTAATAAHRILYDAGSGAVFYDADGNGGAGAVQFAQITAGLALTETDVFIF